MSSVSLWQRLCEYVGLPEYEAKAYVCLISDGPSTARRLSMLCDVPRTKIYETLKKLIERELITEVPSCPKKFAPLSPKGAFKSFLSSYEKKTHDFYTLLSFLEENYTKTVRSANMKREEIWVLFGRPDILRKSSEMISNAEKFVDIITTENGLILFYKVHEKSLDRLGKNGIETRISAPVGSRNQGIVRELRYICKVRHLDTPFPILLINVDHNEFLLARLIPDDYEMSSDKDIAMFCRNPVLCTLMTHLFLDSRIASSNFAKP